MPRIGLDRLGRRAGPLAPGERDLFDLRGTAADAGAPADAGPGRSRSPTPEPVPTPTPPPPLTVKYMGSVENGKGIKVALFVTDKKEVLAGQVGETVMNRFRVMKIGFESVDVQQAGLRPGAAAALEAGGN